MLRNLKKVMKILRKSYIYICIKSPHTYLHSEGILGAKKHKSTNKHTEKITKKAQAFFTKSTSLFYKKNTSLFQKSTNSLFEKHKRCFDNPKFRFAKPLGQHKPQKSNPSTVASAHNQCDWLGPKHLQFQSTSLVWAGWAKRIRIEMTCIRVRRAAIWHETEM